MFTRLFSCLALAVTVLLAQDATTPTDSTSPVPLKFTGVLDAFYSGDLNSPSSGLSLYRSFDWKQGLELNAAEVSVSRDGPEFGFQVDAGYGEMFRIMNLSDPWSGVNRYISQAFVSYKPPLDGIRLDFGKFYTSVGAEVPETYNDFNYSRSLLFVLGEPFYHFGLRATVPVSKTFSTGVLVVNGWNDVRDNNSGKTVGLLSSLTRAKWGWSEIYLTGPEKPGTDIGFRRLYNSVLTLTPTSRVNAYLEALWAMDRRVAGGKDQWSGVAAAAKFSTSKKTSLSFRAERFNDTTGFTTGTPQHLEEGTATFDYRPASFLIARSEFRRDWSDQAVFDLDGKPRASKSQTTMLVGLILVLKGER